jgi:hypothetical protein
LFHGEIHVKKNDVILKYVGLVQDFPSADIQRRLEMLKDLDRTQRRLLSRMWTEIKVR